MTGVEILAIQEVATSFAFNWNSFVVAFCIILGGVTIAGIMISCVNDDWFYLVFAIIVGVLFGCIVGAIFGTGTHTPTEYETRYKVTISDEVSMNEFLEKYEIIDKEGKIYTVRERDSKKG